MAFRSTLLLFAGAIALAAIGCNKSAAVGEGEVVSFLEAAPADQRARILAKVQPGAVAPTPATPVAPSERTDVIGRGDRALTLVGDTPNVGDPAPPFSVIGRDMQPITLADYRGQVLLLSVVPSIDTRVCEMQTHRMSEEVSALPAGAAILTVSRDLPFAQGRFAEDAAIKATLASDYKGGAFGRDWGLVVKETGLLARSLWVIDADGTIVYRELVADQGTEPDYEPALEAMRSHSKSP